MPYWLEVSEHNLSPIFGRTVSYTETGDTIRMPSLKLKQDIMLGALSITTPHNNPARSLS